MVNPHAKSHCRVPSWGNIAAETVVRRLQCGGRGPVTAYGQSQSTSVDERHRIVHI